MTKLNVLIINAGIRDEIHRGELNAELTKIAISFFEKNGFQTCLTDLNNNWELQKELDNILWADLIFVQTPIWAMYVPWPFKRYIDIVMTHPQVCGTDGRSRKDPQKKYGTGGFLTQKHYALSTTWNAPKNALDEPDGFYDGRGLEGALLPLHKQFKYMGVKPLPSFAIHDVYKNPHIEEDLARFESYLQALIKTPLHS